MSPQNRGNVILGLHDPSVENISALSLKIKGYGSIYANKDDIVTIVNNNPEALGILMDINLGDRRGADPTICKTVYDLVEGRIQSGHIAFLGVSGYDPILEPAIRKGIPKEYISSKPWDMDLYIERLDDAYKKLKGL